MKSMIGYNFIQVYVLEGVGGDINYTLFFQQIMHNHT